VEEIERRFVLHIEERRRMVAVSFFEKRESFFVLAESGIQAGPFDGRMVTLGGVSLEIAQFAAEYRFVASLPEGTPEFLSTLLVAPQHQQLLEFCYSLLLAARATIGFVKNPV